MKQYFKQQHQKYNLKFQNELHEPNEWNFVNTYGEFFFVFHVHMISQFKGFGLGCVFCFFLSIQA